MDSLKYSKMSSRGGGARGGDENVVKSRKSYAHAYFEMSRELL